MVEEGFVESLDKGDELVAGRNTVRLRFAGQGGVGRRVTRLLQRTNLGTVRKRRSETGMLVILYWSTSNLY